MFRGGREVGIEPHGVQVYWDFGMQGGTPLATAITRRSGARRCPTHPARWGGSSVRRDNCPMTAILELTRKPPLNLPEVRRGTFDVLVDGRLVGSYELHNAFEAEVEPGKHTVKVRDGRFSSRELSFHVSDGQTVRFNCHGRRISPIFLASFFLPHLGLNLTQVRAK